MEATAVSSARDVHGVWLLLRCGLLRKLVCVLFEGEGGGGNR